MPGPLEGTRIIEIAGIGPGPFCAMMLADMGADVIRVDRSQNVRGGDPATPPGDVLMRGRRSIGVDLKHPDGVEAVLSLIETADGLIEGFRPGVMERLGLGPDAALARNPKLVYGRMTGWGQDGPYAPTAGHDINYIALAGALEAIGRRGGPPTPPLNLVGDFGGGGMLLAFGIACGIVNAQTTGKGQVVDAAMVDGAAVLMTMFHAFTRDGHLGRRARAPTCSTPAPTSTTSTRPPTASTCRSGRSSRSSTPSSLRLTGLDQEELPCQMDKTQWPAMKDRVAAIFRTKTRDEWCELMEGTDVCFAPVLSITRGAAAPAQRPPRDLHRARRHRAAGPGAAVLRDPRRDPAPAVARRAAHRRGAARVGLRRRSRRQAARRRRHRLTPWPPSSRSTPIPTTSRSRPAARWRRRRGRAPRRARLRDPWRARRGRRRRPRRRRDAGRAPRRASASARPTILGAARVAFLDYVDSGMIGTPENDLPGSFWSAPIDEAAERLAAILRRGAGRRPHRLRQRRRLRPPRPHPGPPGRRAGRRAGRDARVFEATMNRDHLRRVVRAGVGVGGPPGRRPPRRQRDVHVRSPRVGHHAPDRRHRRPRREAGLDGRPRQPDRGDLVLPPDAGRGVRRDASASSGSSAATSSPTASWTTTSWPVSDPAGPYPAADARGLDPHRARAAGHLRRRRRCGRSRPLCARSALDGRSSSPPRAGPPRPRAPHWWTAWAARSPPPSRGSTIARADARGAAGPPPGPP